MLTQFLANYFLHNPQKPTLQSIMPSQAVSKIYSGQLPDIQADKLVLKQGEKCRYVDMCALLTQRRYTYRWSSGSSSRWWKGFTHHVSTGESIPQYDLEITKGFLYFTDKRIVFVSNKHCFERKIDKLSAISDFSDGIVLQFGDKVYSLLLPDGNGNVAKAALDLLV